MVKQLMGFHGAERRGGDLVGREQEDSVSSGGVSLLSWEEGEKEDEESEEEDDESEEEEKAASAKVVCRIKTNLRKR